MNYELAKKLKEAGFKQGNQNGQECDMWIKGCYIPTLEELIEACGAEIHELQQIQGVEAGKFYPIKLWAAKSFYHMCTAPTPSEAVANLWIALQEKK